MSAAEADTSGEIVVKGGSCEIHFPNGVFDLDATSEPGKQKHLHKDKGVKIHRIVIKEDSGDQIWDSNDMPSGFKGEIRISYKR